MEDVGFLCPLDYCRPLSREKTTLRPFTERILRMAVSEGVPVLELRGEYPLHPTLYVQSDYVIHELDLMQETQSRPGIRSMQCIGATPGLPRKVEVRSQNQTQIMEAPVMLQDRYETDKIFEDILTLTNEMNPILAEIDRLLDDEELYHLCRVHRDN